MNARETAIVGGMNAFSEINRERCEHPNGFNHQLSDWSLSDWMVACTGELGEAANVIKKLNRIRDNIPGNTHSEENLRWQLRRELCDTFIYLDLMCQAAGFTLGSEVLKTFDSKSEMIGYK